MEEEEVMGGQLCLPSPRGKHGGSAIDVVICNQLYGCHANEPHNDQSRGEALIHR